MMRATVSSRDAEYSPANISRVLVNSQHSPDRHGHNVSIDDSDSFGQNGEQILAKNWNNESIQYKPKDDTKARANHFGVGTDVVGAPSPNRMDDRLQQTREVYLFDCCGLTRELKPVGEYLPIFRALFHVFNTFVFLFGLANLGMGLWFRIDPKVYEIHKYIETQNFTIAGWIMLFGGFLACLVSFMGCLAAVNQSFSLLLCYLFTLIVLMLSLVSTIMMLTIYGLGSTLESFLVKELFEQIRRKTMSTELDLYASSDATQFMDFVQVKMRCCGAADFRDYQKLGLVVPTTCYTIAGNYINAPGCGRAIRRLMDIRAGMATGFSTGSVISQLAAILTTSLLICSIYSNRANPKPLTPPLASDINSANRAAVNTMDTTNRMAPNVTVNYHQPPVP